MYEFLRAKAHVRIRHNRGQELLSEEVVPNILTDAGRRALHTFIYGTAAQRTAASLGVGMHFIGLSDDATAPTASDTSLPAEISGNGLSRVQAAIINLPTGAGTITSLSNQFTYTGVSATCQKSALFDALTGGNMVHEVLFNQRTLVTNDTLTVTFEITLT